MRDIIFKVIISGIQNGTKRYFITQTVQLNTHFSLANLSNIWLVILHACIVQKRVILVNLLIIA